MPNPSYNRSNGIAATDNPTPTASLYPSATGGTVGAATGGASLLTTGATVNAAGGPVAAGAAPAGGLLGQPLTWWAGLIVLWLALGFVARRAGEEREFTNVRISAYNILSITFAAIIGIVGLKTLFNRFPIPGVTTLVNSA